MPVPKPILKLPPKPILKLPPKPFAVDWMAPFKTKKALDRYCVKPGIKE